MDAHHATLGRRTLEEIDQKRAAGRLHKASSGHDLDSSNVYGAYMSEGGIRATERDAYMLPSRLEELESRNTELEGENQQLLSRLGARDAKNDSLIKRVNELEDALAQLRTMKKRLKEAEEDQYRAKEDAATLRAELSALPQQGFGNSFSIFSSIVKSAEEIAAMEKEMADLRLVLQQESHLRLQEQQKLADEQLRVSSLIAEKQMMENKIDSQSSEIKRLLEENSNMTTSYQEAMSVAMQWENQVPSLT
ncbi:hypothetical protein J5N97_006183 [Dioscorea zingiberensis]|uniref:Uncharacterized protein n=1 Tax=Dioscorea zingiberensis TaxID=325984 RepID=A0A9D5HTR2_9LILI|nr:hypothetical protein J5N97_006183 [Dioscorea zingiberensis]